MKKYVKFSAIILISVCTFLSCENGWTDTPKEKGDPYTPPEKTELNVRYYFTTETLLGYSDDTKLFNIIFTYKDENGVEHPVPITDANKKYTKNITVPVEKQPFNAVSKLKYIRKSSLPAPAHTSPKDPNVDIYWIYSNFGFDYSTGHSESILTTNLISAQRFQCEVEAACVYVNSSTRFTDGGEFGFGAELGISTQKFHARGPMGLEALTSIKYLIDGDGHTR
ncbi:hypothetical protein FACS1894190_12800 [Spirochaetia bacterium]|nr:hypothetical protein FACS1894190_12800 [Spirochaetia bacterium]